ncbi:MAG: hemolysin family protein [Streptococcaceae bacterium]|jgi:putative hemolysin|nr:hemolysin family protein [Streptococcaceae bacterium]
MNGDPESSSLVLQFIILIFLTLLNAFFSASEMAVVSLNKNRLEQKADEGDRKSKQLLKIVSSPNNFLSTIQVGITLINILAGASLAESLADKIAPLLGGTQTAKTIASFVALALLTYISIVFGELYPKRIALNLNEKIASFSSGPITLLGYLLSPFVWLLSASTNLLSRITPMKFDDEMDKMTRDEMAYMLSNDDVLDSSEIEMLQGVFSLDNMVARELMVPRTDSFMVDINDGTQENLRKILDNNYSRIPVYDDDKDKVIGVLHTKTILSKAYQNGFTALDLRQIMQEPLFVPETIFVDDLLLELKKTQNQMAICLDEYGGVGGIITLEDLLEEIVGDIDDESDLAAPLFEKLEDNCYIVQGKMLINEFNEEFDTSLENNDVDTMGGFLISAIGRIPDDGEKASFELDTERGHLTLISEEVTLKRINSLKVIFTPLDLETDSDDDK